MSTPFIPRHPDILRDEIRKLERLNRDLLTSLQDCLALIVNGPDGCDDDPKRIEAQARAIIHKATQP